ncbi:hypothetical protein [Fischerella sp. JS2]|uniref:hypothetical protein n=1 Tax=Fischerella sp. JS2 TaxID=2597771 RepID=UPI0028E348C0|nr:hypothetical protein [Fischerella sp. JS2]
MNKGLLPFVLNNYLKFIFGYLFILLLEALSLHPVYSQTANSNQSATVGNESSFNQILQSSPQVPVTNSNTSSNNNNSNTINYPNIYPLNYLPNAYVNTENDFGFNLSAGVNTLDASNVTIYLGIIYQPGRTEDHKARMARIRKETELLEVHKKTMEANLTLLQKQIEEATIRLQRLQQSSPQK